MAVDEAAVKADMCGALRAAAFKAIRHEDTRTAGVPDISATGRGVTLWFEVKLRKPGAGLVDMDGTAAQWEMVRDLAARGSGAWVVRVEPRVSNIAGRWAMTIFAVTRPFKVDDGKAVYGFDTVHTIAGARKALVLERFAAWATTMARRSRGLA